MISGEPYPEGPERVTTNFSVDQGKVLADERTPFIPKLTPEQRQKAIADFVLYAAQVQEPNKEIE